jgi:hypothetical protein
VKLIAFFWQKIGLMEKSEENHQSYLLLDYPPEASHALRGTKETVRQKPSELWNGGKRELRAELFGNLLGKPSINGV